MPTKRLFFSSGIVLMALAGSGTALWGQAGGFAYVVNNGSNDVSAYTIDGTTGALIPVDGSPFPAGFQARSVAVDPTGQFAYVANFLGEPLPGSVSAYTIDGDTGALTAVDGSPFPAGLNPQSVTVEPKGQFAYVANRRSNNVSAYAIDGTTGALTPVDGAPFPAGLFPQSVTADRTGQFVYVANCGSPCGRTPGDVSAYRIDRDSGGLMPVDGSPFPSGTAPQSVTVDPTGQFVYVANCGSPCRVDAGNVSVYTVDEATGALTPVDGSPFPAGTNPLSVTVDPTGQFAYVANNTSSNVSAYAIDRDTGGLMPVDGSPFPAGPRPSSVIVDPTGQFAYVANGFGSGANNVSAYAIDGTTGALTPVTGSPFAAGIGPVSVTTTTGPAARFAGGAKK
jgi:DNA-binding beta-propeller fold protein YncE